MDRKPISGREIAMLAAAGALLYGIQVVLAALPNIEGVTLLIILFSLVFGRRVLWRCVLPCGVEPPGAIQPLRAAEREA